MHVLRLSTLLHYQMWRARDMARSLTARLRTKSSRAGLSVLASLTKQNVCYEILMYYPWVFLFFFIFLSFCYGLNIGYSTFLFVQFIKCSHFLMNICQNDLSLLISFSHCSTTWPLHYHCSVSTAPSAPSTNVVNVY